MVTRLRNRKNWRIEGDFDMMQFLIFYNFSHFFCWNRRKYSHFFPYLPQKALLCNGKVLLPWKLVASIRKIRRNSHYFFKSIATAIIFRNFRFFSGYFRVHDKLDFCLPIDIKYLYFKCELYLIKKDSEY